MPWIPLHTTLPACAKLARLSRKLARKKVVCAGHLTFLWLWAMEQAPDGVLKAYTPDEICDAAEWTGNSQTFIAALIECHWLDEDMRIHNWPKHGGKFLTRKKLDRSRQRRHRGKSVTRDKGVSHALVTRDTGVTNALVTHESHGYNALEERREEKSREEENKGGVVVPQVAVVEPHSALATLQPPPPESRSFPEYSGEFSAQNGSDYAEWPTLAQWQAAAAMEGMTPAQIQAEWDNQERKTQAERWKGIDPQRLRHHAAFVLTKIRQRGGDKPPPGTRGAAKSFSHEQPATTKIKILNQA